MENNKAKYKIISKHLNGLDITKFTLEVIEDGRQTVASYEDVLKLARLCKIYGVEAVMDTINQKYIIDYKGLLQSIPVYSQTRLTPVCRILNKRDECVGYRAVDSDNKSYKISTNKLWSLALNNCVIGVEAKIIGNKKALVGTEQLDIKNLPKIVE